MKWGIKKPQPETITRWELPSWYGPNIKAASQAETERDTPRGQDDTLFENLEKCSRDTSSQCLANMPRLGGGTETNIFPQSVGRVPFSGFTS